MDNTTIPLLDDALAWTAARIAVIRADQLDSPTPCTRWNLQELLDHTIGTLTMLTDAVAPPAENQVAPPPGSTRWDHAIAQLAARSGSAWAAEGVADRSFDLPIGTMPAPVLASATMLETVVHGWDISQATGEAAQIPDGLAVPILDFARAALDDTTRGDNFAADLGIGDSASDRLVAFLGRKPL